MLGLLVSLVLLVIIGGVLYWAVMKLAGAFGLPAPIIAVLQVAIVIILLVILLGYFFPSGHLLVYR